MIGKVAFLVVSLAAVILFFSSNQGQLGLFFLLVSLITSYLIHREFELGKEVVK